MSAKDRKTPKKKYSKDKKTQKIKTKSLILNQKKKPKKKPKKRPKKSLKNLPRLKKERLLQ